MEKIKINSIKAWILAARPKTLAGAATPVMIGTSIAYMDGKFQWLPACICLLFAFLMQIVANFINDLFDFLKGTDREDRLGPKRACAQNWISPQAMKTGIIVTTVLACAFGSILLLYAGWELIIVGIVCVLFAFLYTTGPYPLSYHGWGDLLVLVFFGFVPVGCTYYVQAHSWTPTVTIASLICGFVIDTLLVINNYRDREADEKSGKKTIIRTISISVLRNLCRITLSLIPKRGKPLCCIIATDLFNPTRTHVEKDGKDLSRKSPQ